MYAPANLARYGVVSVSTASPGRLLVLLYDAMFRFLREGVAAMQAGEKGRASERITRAHAILTELLSGLDHTRSPELCTTLEGLYAFCMQTAVEAMVEQNPEKVASILKVLAPLRDAWSTAVAQTETSAAPAPALRKAG
jgi:flagellar protein FliS